MDIIDEISLKIKKYDSKLVDDLFSKYKDNSDKLSSFIDKLPSEVLTNELIIKAIKSGYKISKNTPDTIKYNEKYILAILNREYNADKAIAAILKYVKQESLTNKINEAISNDLSYHCLDYLKYVGCKITDKRLLINLIKANSYVINIADESLLTEDIVLLAIKNGFVITNKAPKIILDNIEKYIVPSIMANKRNPIIDYCLPNQITDEVIKLSVDNGYYIREKSPTHIKENYNLIKNIIEKGDLTQIRATLMYCDSSVLTCELMKTSIEKGYEYSEETPNCFMKYYDVLYCFIEKMEECPYEIFSLCDPKILDDKIVLLAIEKGYTINHYTPKEISTNKRYVYEILKKDDFSSINSTLEIIDMDMLDIDVIIDLVKKWPDVLISKILLYENAPAAEKMFKEKYYSLISTISEEKKTKLELLKERFGYTISVIYYDSYIFSDELIDKLGFENVYRLFKYGFLADDYDCEFDLKKIIDNNELELLCFSYISITKKQINNLDILLFIKFINFYNNNDNVIKEIINKHKIDEYRTKLLLLIDNKYNIKLKSLQDLNEINKIIYENNKKSIIEATSGFDGSFYQRQVKLKNNLCLLLTGEKYCDMYNFVTYVLNAEKARNLQNRIVDYNVKELLDCYIYLISILEFIFNASISELIKLLEILNEYYINNTDKFNVLTDNFKDIEKITKYLYGCEANSSLTNIGSLKSSKNVIIKKNRYTSKNIVEGESLEGRTADYIEINQDAYFFAHVMNAYGRGGRISDFKNPRVIGSTYICLSSITNKAKSIVPRKTDSINKVTLLFDNIDPNSLIMMCNRDMNSSGDTNSLYLKASRTNFDTLKETLNKTDKYNEYVIYRENMNREYIYPSAVLVTGMVPNKYEIDAAIYLGVPLVKINKKRTIKKRTKSKDENISYTNNIEFLHNKDIDLIRTSLDDIVEEVKKRR